MASLLSAWISLLVKSRARAPTIGGYLLLLGKMWRREVDEMCRNEVVEMVEMVSWSAKV
jgi:hypothetical protein